MTNVRDVLTLGIMAGMGLAIILNADKAATVISSVSSAFLGLIRTASGTDASQRPGARI